MTSAKARFVGQKSRKTGSCYRGNESKQARTRPLLQSQSGKLLLAVLEKFAGGPVGLDNLAAAIGEERDTIEDVLEPYLIQQGYLMRTPRGRMATQLAYQHFGLAVPKNLMTEDWPA